jgi:hypothetical protein
MSEEWRLGEKLGINFGEDDGLAGGVYGLLGRGGRAGSLALNGRRGLREWNCLVTKLDAFRWGHEVLRGMHMLVRGGNLDRFLWVRCERLSNWFADGFYWFRVLHVRYGDCSGTCFTTETLIGLLLMISLSSTSSVRRRLVSCP